MPEGLGDRPPELRNKICAWTGVGAERYQSVGLKIIYTKVLGSSGSFAPLARIIRERFYYNNSGSAAAMCLRARFRRASGQTRLPVPGMADRLLCRRTDCSNMPPFSGSMRPARNATPEFAMNRHGSWRPEIRRSTPFLNCLVTEFAGVLVCLHETTAACLNPHLFH